MFQTKIRDFVPPMLQRQEARAPSLCFIPRQELFSLRSDRFAQRDIPFFFANFRKRSALKNKIADSFVHCGRQSAFAVPLHLPALFYHWFHIVGIERSSQKYFPCR